MRNMVSVHPLSYSLLMHSWRSTLDIALFDTLSSNGHQATRTVRKNRIDKILLESEDALKNKERVAFDYRIEGTVNMDAEW